jgi:hypothetical protein
VAIEEVDDPDPGIGRRLLVVAGVEHGEQRQRRVAEPAVAVVPVADAADVLRERGRRRGDDPARGRVRKRLEYE